MTPSAVRSSRGRADDKSSRSDRSGCFCINNHPFVALGDTPTAPSTDLNGDGAQTVADAILLSRYIAEDAALDAATLAAIDFSAADLDGDGFLTLLDVKAPLAQISA